MSWSFQPRGPNDDSQPDAFSTLPEADPFALGIVIYLWCSHNFVFLGRGTPLHFTPIENLLVTGLYGYVRNPMYVGALLIVAGEALLFQSLGLSIYALASFGVLHLFILHFVEPHLT